MRLKSVTLQEFRQFHGTQTLSFSDSNRNVTMVFGANGSGKTTLLNAFTWAFYGELTDDFEQKDHLLNERTFEAMADGAEATASVSIRFEHDGRDITIGRASRYRRDGSRRVLLADAEPEMLVRGADGQERIESDPRRAMEQILPKQLRPFFFFNGERIGELVREDAYDQVESAIKTILGLQVIEDAQTHLEEVVKGLEKEARRLDRDGDTDRVGDELDGLRLQKGKLEEELAQAGRNRDSHKRDLQAVADKLKSLEQTKELQQEREDRSARLKEGENKISQLQERLAGTISREGPMALLAGQAPACLERIRSLKDSGQIPSAVSQSLIDEILEREECICGTHVGDAGSPVRQRLEALLREAGQRDVEDQWLGLEARIEGMVGARETMQGHLATLNADIDDAQDSVAGLKERLAEISKELKSGETEEIANLENRRERLDKELEDRIRGIGALELKIKDHQAQIKDAEERFRAAEVHGEEAILAKRRVSAAQEARDVLERMLEIGKQQIRLKLDRRIKDVYSQISFKNYVPELTEDFKLLLRKAATGERAPQSTGENQILSLCFVGAVAAIAREQYEANEKRDDQGSYQFRGGIYPIVMDSAFGSLDENYQKPIAQLLPRLAPQVVTMTSKSQGYRIVRKEMQEFVGREAVVTYHSDKPEAEPEEISLAGTAWPYICVDDPPREWAEITEVTR